MPSSARPAGTKVQSSAPPAASASAASARRLPRSSTDARIAHTSGATIADSHA